jgi:hypothetical protein
MNNSDDKIVSLDIQEINLDAPSNPQRKSFRIDTASDIPSSSLGEGIELLMNDRVKNTHTNSGGSGLKSMEQELNDLNELNNIEPELLSSETENRHRTTDSFKNKPAVEIAKGTSKMDEHMESWDGFKDINQINIDTSNEKSVKLSEEELLREKFEVLRKLEKLEEKGANLSKKYSMENDLDEMKGEYEFLINEKEKSNSMKFQGKVLTTMITGLEFLNNKFDPFDIKLDGWSEQINENVEDYDDIFAELHEKYKSKAKMAPEIKLMFQLASAGIMIHMTNTMFKSALPGMDDIMRQNPDLMGQFTKAAVNSMEQNQPGLSNFMNDFGRQDANESSARPPSQNQTSSQSTNSIPRMRQEMKGPETANIDSILSNLNKEKKSIQVDNNSTISMDEINSLAVENRRGKSRRNSDKNTISLAI